MAATKYPFENAVPKTAAELAGFGCYPPGYNRRVHGTYDPSRYYGPKDTALSEVRISELAAWIGRRDKSPRAMSRAISRTFFRWHDKFVNPRKATAAPVFQFIFAVSTFCYLSMYHKTLSHHKWHKYHW